MIARALAFLLCAAAAAAQGFPDAKASYDAGRWAQAESAFAQLLRETPDDAALHYALGNARYKNGRLGPAVASYQRAFDLDPRHPDIRHNLEFALRRAGEELVPDGIPAPAFRVLTWLSGREAGGAFWLAAWIAALLAAWALRASGARRAGLLSWAARAGVVAALFGAWRLGLAGVAPSGRGVIVAAKAELRNGPGSGFSVGWTAPEGRRVRVLGRSGSWLEVGVAKEGVKGWVEASAIETLD